MGRVYTVNPNTEAGERSGKGCRLFTHRGEKLPPITRVEFDDDTDAGMATVTGYACFATLHGASIRYVPILDYAANAPCAVTYRTWVQLVPAGQPDPPSTPGATLWRGADGSIVAGADPVPAVPFTSPEIVRG